MSTKPYDKKSTNLEKAVEDTWKNAMRKVMYDEDTTLHNSSKLNNLWWEIDEEATKWENDNLNKLCRRNVAKIDHDCSAVMDSLFDMLWMPKLDCKNVCDNLKIVCELFDELKTKNKNSNQVVAHKKSEEKDPKKHDADKLILAQTIYITSVCSESEIYIASNDRKFFSPYKGDSTITNAIRIKFEITCDSPEKIVDKVKKILKIMRENPKKE